MRQKYSPDQQSNIGDARLTESIDNVKEVALNCEKKIKELKVCKVSVMQSKDLHAVFWLIVDLSSTVEWVVHPGGYNGREKGSEKGVASLVLTCY